MIPKQQFGRTGHLSTRTVFGAACLGKADEATADRALETLLEYGVNHIDTARAYGESEVLVGQWMPAHRDRFFLATKSGKRTRAEAWTQLQESLEHLQTDHVDLWQLHELVHADEWETALGPGGALEAAVEARRQGLVRYIGVTGHGLTCPSWHLKSLKRFDFDAVLLPCNYLLLQQHPRYAADFTRLEQVCRERNVAMQVIKSLACRPDASSPYRYRPFSEQTDVDMVTHWALGRPQLFLDTVADAARFGQVLDAAGRYAGPPSDEAMRGLMERSGAALFTGAVHAIEDGN